MQKRDGACCAGPAAVLSRLGLPCLEAYAPRQKLSQAEFESLISYLAAVPLFRKQLPRAELPKVARAFRHRQWNPGDKVVRQGEDGRAFFIIQSGEASVVVQDPDGGESDRATLYCLDYFGGHTLIEKRPNVATIVAKGPAPLVTLSMSREDFEAFGLNKKLKFPRRPAIYDGHRTDVPAPDLPDRCHVGPGSDGPGKEQLTEAQASFLCKALRANPNLRRALGSVSEEKVQQIAKVARLRRIAAGSYLGQSGEILPDFYVVAEGSFDVLPGSAYQHRSVEATVSNLTKAQKRLFMKEKFVAYLETPKAAKQGGCRAASVVVEPVMDGGSVAVAKTRSRGGNRCQSLAGWEAMQRKSGRADESPFQLGDHVARVVVGDALLQEAGHVVEVVKHGPAGEVRVEFVEPQRQEVVKVQQLRPAQAMTAIATLKSGMCYGDLCLLYNTRLVTTCCAREDSVVYAISRSRFKESFGRDGALFEEHIRLLDDVHLLNPLVRAERWELARSAAGVLEFKPGEVVLQQGKQLGSELGEQLLYILKTGSCVIRKESVNAAGEAESRELATLQRGQHFGERAIFRNDGAAEFSVDAGPQGMTCLAIHGQILRKLLVHVDVAGQTTDFGGPGLAQDVAEYCALLPKTASTSATQVRMADLDVLGLLGEGGFGSVFLVRAGDAEYALKRLSKGYVAKAQAQRQVCMERDILTMVDSSFIIKLCQTYKDAEYVYMLLELCSGGHLFQLLAACKTAGPAVLPSSVMFYIASVTFAFEHLHERHIAYRDLKAENVLLDGQGYVKLCDMGFAKFVVDKTTTLLGTADYMAPEMIDPPHAHNCMVDWWALGVLTFELLTGQVPWYNGGIESDADPMAQLLAIRDSHDDGFPERLIPRHLSLAKDFIKRLLCISVRRRLGFRGGATEVRQDPWFASKKFDFDALVAQTMRPPELPERKPASPQRAPVTALGPTRPPEGQDALFAPAQDGDTGWDKDF